MKHDACLMRPPSITNKKREALPIQPEGYAGETFFFEENYNAMERRKREWGIRVFGVKESKGEDSRQMLPRYNLSGIGTLELASFEHCHRISPIGNNGSTTITMNRPIIATVVSRPLRNYIIRSAKANLNRSTTGEGVYVLEDMTKIDY